MRSTSLSWFLMMISSRMRTTSSSPSHHATTIICILSLSNLLENILISREQHKGVEKCVYTTKKTTTMMMTIFWASFRVSRVTRKFIIQERMFLKPLSNAWKWVSTTTTLTIVRKSRLLHASMKWVVSFVRTATLSDPKMMFSRNLIIWLNYFQY